MGRALSVIVLIVIAAVVAPGQAGAATARTEEHCVVRVIDQKSSGEMILSEPACYESFDAAMVSEGVGAWGDGAAALAAIEGTATFTIGIHYDGADYSGSSTSVVGSDCAGGWLNVSMTWDNRISSTRNGCPRIRHYTGTNLSGIFETTYSPGGNLAVVNNQTSSIQYLS
jgi:hypothetical protein